jgi:hypothetical protein
VSFWTKILGNIHLHDVTMYAVAIDEELGQFAATWFGRA